MSEPIKIVVTAQTQEAAAALQQFAQTTGAGFQQVAKHAEGAAAAFANNRMALMELGHSARSVADGLAAGMSPLRLAMMESPRLMQAMGEASSEFRSKIIGMLPAIGGVVAAVGALAAAWSYYGESLTDPTKRMRDMADALDKVPDLVEKINTAMRAGTLQPGQAQKYLDMLSGKTPLYNQSTTPDAFGGHAATIKNGAFGMFGEQFPQLTTDPNLRNSRTGAVIGQRQPANEADIVKYVQQMMRSDKVTQANDNANPLNAALVKMHEEAEKMQRDAEIGIQKEMDRIKDRYKKERDDITATHNLAQDLGKITPDKEKEYQDALAASKISEEASIADLQQKVLDEQAKKEADTLKKWDEDKRTTVERQQKDLDDAATAAMEYQRSNSVAMYQQIYDERLAMANRELDAELITNEQYDDLIAKAGKEKIANEKEYTAELEKRRQLKQEIPRDEIEAQLKGVQDNPFLTSGQKQDQSIPLMQQLQGLNAGRINELQQDELDPTKKLEAQRQITQLMVQQAQLADKIAEAEHPWATAFTKLAGEAQITMATLAQNFSNVFNSAIHSISSGITSLIEGTKTWGQALRQIGASILNEIISAIVQMGVRWVMTQLMMAIMGRSILTAATATIAPVAAAQSAIWAAPATLATIASYGSAAMAAPGFIGTAESITLGMAGFEEGGYTGRGNAGDVAGIVHRGEYVMPADVVDRVGLGNLEALHKGGSPAATAAMATGNSGNSGKVQIANFFDTNKLMDHLHRSPGYENHIVDIMANNIHKFR